MRNKARKSAVFALMLVISLLLAGHESTIRALAITSESIQQKESQINDIKNQKKQLESSLTDIENVRNQLAKEKSNLQSYVKTLDANLTEIQEKIDALKTSIEEKQTEIDETEKELAEAVATQNAQYEAMKKRIQFMYEEGGVNSLEFLLGAASYSEMLNKTEFIEAVASYDRKKLEEYAATTKYVETCKKQLDEEKAFLEAAKKGVEEEEASVEALISDKTTEISAYSADINNKDAAIKEYKDEIASQNATIAALEKAVAEEKRRLAEAGGQKRTYDGGMFCFPAPSYTRISDDYGERVHPVLGVTMFHNGVDMAAPSGSPILAAYDGEVVAAAYSGSMGNYIMIDHGDGLYTIYMHASALYVSKGQTVTKGQNIAAVGSTGRSTGPHLHFGVRLNGSYVSPWGYIS